MKHFTVKWNFRAMLGLAAVLFLWIAYWAISRYVFEGDLAKSGQFGDTFGAINALFTGWAFVVVLATLIQQSHQIEQIKRDSQEGREFRLRLDLYERRFRIFRVVSDFIGSVMFDDV